MVLSNEIEPHTFISHNRAISCRKGHRKALKTFLETEDSVTTTSLVVIMEIFKCSEFKFWLNLLVNSLQAGHLSKRQHSRSIRIVFLAMEHSVEVESFFCSCSQQPLSQNTLAWVVGQLKTWRCYFKFSVMCKISFASDNHLQIVDTSVDRGVASVPCINLSDNGQPEEHNIRI